MHSVVLCTCRNEKEAEKIASEILGKKLAACVNIIPKVRSRYLWKGKMVRENESMMVIKTRTHLMDRLINLVKKIHSYDVPEIIELTIVKGNREYLNWVSDATSKKAKC